MKILEITSQHRRDFRALFTCEGCQSGEVLTGYDDTNFHQNVIPAMVCKSCGKSSNSLGVDVRPLAPRHPEGKVV